jgi:hypothetical protein
LVTLLPSKGLPKPWLVKAAAPLLRGPAGSSPRWNKPPWAVAAIGIDIAITIANIFSFFFVLLFRMI